MNVCVCTPNVLACLSIRLHDTAVRHQPQPPVEADAPPIRPDLIAAAATGYVADSHWPSLCNTHIQRLPVSG